MGSGWKRCGRHKRVNRVNIRDSGSKMIGNIIWTIRRILTWRGWRGSRFSQRGGRFSRLGSNRLSAWSNWRTGWGKRYRVATRRFRVLIARFIRSWMPSWLAWNRGLWKWLRWPLERHRNVFRSMSGCNKLIWLVRLLPWEKTCRNSTRKSSP